MWADDQASRGLGMEAQVIEVDHAVVRMTVTDAMVNGHDIAHGGFIFTLADSTFALACNCRGRSRSRPGPTSPSSPRRGAGTCSSPTAGCGRHTGAAGSPT